MLKYMFMLASVEFYTTTATLLCTVTGGSLMQVCNVCLVYNCFSFTFLSSLELKALLIHITGCIMASAHSIRVTFSTTDFITARTCLKEISLPLSIVNSSKEHVALLFSTVFSDEHFNCV